MRARTASAKRRGPTDDELAAIADPARWAATFPPGEVAALELATRLAHGSHDLGAERIARLREHYDARQLAELLLVAGQANLNNRVGNAAKQLSRDR